MFRSIVSRSALLCLCMCSATAVADDWPHWRGPNRDGTTAESSGYGDGTWPNRELWHANVGDGGTSPIFVDGCVYAIGLRDGPDVVQCLDAATGKQLWHVSYPSRKYGRHATGDEGLYSGPNATPEYDTETGYLYTLSIDGELHCWNTKRDGQQVWKLNLYDKYKAPRRPKVGRQGLRDYGYTTAPLVHRDWLIVEVGSVAGNLIAFDKRTGEQVWTSKRKDPAGHTGGPAPLKVEGVPCVAVLTLYGLHVARLDVGNEGKTVAFVEWTTDFANNIASPAVFDDHAVITSGYNHNAIALMKLSLSGAQKVWEQPLASLVCTPVVHGGHIYWAWQKLHCLDLKTGQPRWAGGNFSDAGSCIVTGDDRLIVWGGSGTLCLAETAKRSPDRFTQLADKKNLATTDVWPHAALADGRLFCKDRTGNLRCFSLK